ncbi:hypothetical protein BaRGS_00016680 [Batillaria attramentaria]|uniref:Uncharacterized protein n=1 Tax=Batillaria attramentaria TaxID=370345 RepID=A0ABD0KY61_9CAEN
MTECQYDPDSGSRNFPTAASPLSCTIAQSSVFGRAEKGGHFRNAFQASLSRGLASQGEVRHAENDVTAAPSQTGTCPPLAVRFRLPAGPQSNSGQYRHA